MSELFRHFENKAHTFTFEEAKKFLEHWVVSIYSFLFFRFQVYSNIFRKAYFLYKNYINFSIY